VFFLHWEGIQMARDAKGVVLAPEDSLKVKFDNGLDLIGHVQDIHQTRPDGGGVMVMWARFEVPFEGGDKPIKGVVKHTIGRYLNFPVDPADGVVKAKPSPYREVKPKAKKRA
jgi:hypothetical protein